MTQQLIKDKMSIQVNTRLTSNAKHILKKKILNNYSLKKINS
jgi:hypothetical protein